MKIINNLFVLFFLLFSVSCSSVDMANDKETTAQLVSSQEDHNICFETKMEKWYLAFNYYQNKGYDIDEADRKATAAANEAFRACQGGSIMQLANNDVN